MIKGGLIYKKTSQVSTMVNDVISRIIVSDIDDFSEKVSAYDEYGNLVKFIDSSGKIYEDEDGLDGDYGFYGSKKWED